MCALCAYTPKPHQWQSPRKGMWCPMIDSGSGRLGWVRNIIAGSSSRDHPWTGGWHQGTSKWATLTRGKSNLFLQLSYFYFSHSGSFVQYTKLKFQLCCREGRVREMFNCIKLSLALTKLATPSTDTMKHVFWLIICIIATPRGHNRAQDPGSLATLISASSTHPGEAPVQIDKRKRKKSNTGKRE